MKICKICVGIIIGVLVGSIFDAAIFGASGASIPPMPFSFFGRSDRWWGDSRKVGKKLQGKANEANNSLNII